MGVERVEWSRDLGTWEKEAEGYEIRQGERERREEGPIEGGFQKPAVG